VKDLLLGLNDSQRAVVLHHEGPALVAAVAGSGKTRTVVHRVARLVQDGVPASQILCLSFSKDAATEMDVRLARLGSPAKVGTFHALAFSIWRDYYPERARTFEVDSGGTSYRRVIEAAASKAGRSCARTIDLSLADTLFGFAKNELLYPERAGVTRDRVCALFAKHVRDPEVYADLYDETEYVLDHHQNGTLPKAYQPILRSLRKPFLTFDDMIARVVFLLQDNPAELERAARRYAFVIQDEAQDQNYARVVLAELLAAEHQNYMLVGDPGQTIYTFAGARPDLFLDFEARWGAVRYTLPENYRCASSIIDVGNRALLSVSPEGRLPGLQLVGQRKDVGVVQTLEADGVYSVARTILEDIQTELAAGRPAREIAVLCRFNTHAQAIVELLLDAKIPLQARALGMLYLRAEIKALLAYYALALGTGTAEDLVDVLQRPMRFVKATLAPVIFADWQRAGAADPSALGGYTFHHDHGNPHLNSRESAVIGQLESQLLWLRTTLRDQEALYARLVTLQAEVERLEADDEGGEAAEAAQRRSRRHTPLTTARQELEEGTEDFFENYAPQTVFERLLEHLDYFRFLEDKEGKETVSNTRIENVRRLGLLQQRYELSKDFVAWATWVRAHASVRRVKDSTLDAVTVSTVHTAKGLEWPVVYLAEFNDDAWPAPQAKQPRELEEEKRLVYVAATRAKERLVFVLDSERPPSRFLPTLLNGRSFKGAKASWRWIP
jgi:DNA helicase II / ATP-dependent DNA helicase PcrA